MGERFDDRSRPRDGLILVADAADVLRELRARADAEAAKADFDRRVLRYCAEHGIPRSVFLGRVVAPGEPLWLREDVVAALQHQADEDALCPGCRQPRVESFDTAARYTVETHKCQSCAAQGQKSWLAEKNRPKNASPQHGVFYTVSKVE